jgi:hypothetical protein
VATKDFMGDLVKVIGPKYDPPQALQEKVLSSIQVWYDKMLLKLALQNFDQIIFEGVSALFLSEYFNKFVHATPSI